MVIWHLKFNIIIKFFFEPPSPQKNLYMLLCVCV